MLSKARTSAEEVAGEVVQLDTRLALLSGDKQVAKEEEPAVVAIPGIGLSLWLGAGPCSSQRGHTTGAGRERGAGAGADAAGPGPRRSIPSPAAF